MLNTLQTQPTQSGTVNEQEKSDRVRYPGLRFAEVINERRSAYLLMFFGALLALIACWNLPPDVPERWG
jgi:hypothetical protein